ncbi:hypothetical protein CSC94_23350 [Zhengella mangrovi]|uniref:Uncharacterized protein n=1 Tax=Zhengella mangrovi TaxID=1982044 RepID=A0A2G1QHC6_9HYPH|nr:hypothetical protein [Zhengella mangrovi]PHP64638.1 hypothetical protein CSC94_23350 [Zhengella mangrovi]
MILHGPFSRLPVHAIRFVLLALLASCLSPGVALSQTYEYVRSEFNQSVLASVSYGGFDWAYNTHIADFNGSLDIGGFAKADGVVSYQAGEGEYFSILSWSRPYFDTNTREIRMYGSVVHMRKPNAVRISMVGDPSGEATAYAGRIATFVQPASWTPLAVGGTFVLTVGGGDGSSLSEPFFARYYFRRLD